MKKENLPHGGPSGALSLTDSTRLVDKGSSGATFVRSSIGTVVDGKGIQRTLRENTAPIEGGHLVPNLNRQSSMSMEPTYNTNMHFFNHIIHGTIMYVCYGTDGLVVVNIANPAAPFVMNRRRMHNPLTDLDTWTPMTDCVIMGNHLFCVGRKIHLPYDDDPVANPNVETGIINVFDITVPSAPVYVFGYMKPTVTLRTSPDLLRSYAEEWYQGICTDGTYLYVSHQYTGMSVFDWDTTTADELTEVGYNNVGMEFPITVWETSNIDINAAEDHLFLSNHGFGIKILDIATPTSPGGTLLRDIEMVRPNGVPMRIRDVICETVNGVEYMFGAPNTDGTYGQSDERGLCCLDITNPATIATDGSDWIHTKIGADMDDQWDNMGDKPIQGLDRIGDFIFMANGQKGIAVFDISVLPKPPEFLGNLSAPIEAGVNVYRMVCWEQNNKMYISYGDGPGFEQVQNAIMYTDEIVLEFKAGKGYVPRGIKIEPPRTNLLGDAHPTGGQRVAGLPLGVYTLSCGGPQDAFMAISGIAPAATLVTLSGHNQARTDAPTTFEVTVSGDVWTNVNNGVEWAQLEEGAYVSSFMELAEPRVLHGLTIPAIGLIKNTGCSGYLEYTPDVNDFLENTETVLLEIGPTRDDSLRIYTGNFGTGDGRFYIRKAQLIGGANETAYIEANPKKGVPIRIAWSLDFSQTNTFTAWVNGVELISPITDTNPMIIESGVISIGRRQENPENPCQGSIKDMKFWNKPMPQEFLKNFGKKMTFETVTDFTFTMVDGVDNCFGITKHGDRLLCCLGLGGLGVADVSNPYIPVVEDQAQDTEQTGTWTAVRQVVADGNNLFLACRDNEGSIEAYSMNPSTGALTGLGYYETTGTGGADGAGGAGTEDCRYSDLSFNGVDVCYMAGRQGGIESIDISDPATMSRIDYVHDTDFETMGGCLYKDNYISFNYSRSNYALMVTPVDASGNFGTTVKTPVVYIGRPYVRPRPWWGCAEDDIIYCACNDNNEPTEFAGLAVYDCSDLTQPLPLMSYTGIEGLTLTVGAPDQPCMGMKKFGKWVFMGAGNAGIAVFDVENPYMPILIGTFNASGASLNVTYMEVWEDGGEIFIAYGNSAHTGTDNRIYIDKVIIHE